MRQQIISRLRTLNHQLALLVVAGSNQNNKAQELVEYALMVGFIAVSVAATIPYQVTGPVSAIFSKIQIHMTSQGG
jgi:Flp pilus assembly pilin Flp